MHVAPPLGSPFRLHSIHRSPQSTRLSSLCYSRSPLASVHTWQCTHVSPSLPVNPTITSPRPLSTCLFLCLHLCSGRVNRFIYAIFLDSTYMCEYTACGTLLMAQGLGIPVIQGTWVRSLSRIVLRSDKVHVPHKYGACAA